ncbi:Hypothetical predicted protein, partial [Podarcis lilfordi]
GGRRVDSPEKVCSVEEDKKVSFTMNIQAEGTEVSMKRLVGDIKAFLTEEKEITEYSLNVEGQRIPGQPNSAEQRIRFTLHIKGQGMESALKRLLKKTKFLVLGQKEFRNISMNIKGPGISPSTYSLIQEINVFLKEERGGTEVSPEEEDKKVSFTLNIQAEGTEVSTKRLVGDIKAFLTEEKEITEYSLNVRGQEIPGQPNSAEQRIRFTLHIKGQGMESALKRLVKKTRFLLLAQKEFRNISMNIKGPGISPSTYSLIQEINVFLKEERGGTEVSPEEEDKKVSFTLNIQAEGTEVSTKRLVGDIKAFLTEEKEITEYSLNVRGQEIPGQPNSAEQRIRFTLHIKGQGMESALKRLLKMTRFLVLVRKEFRNISMNIKGPGISPSTHSLIQEINVFLKEERGGTEVYPEEEDKNVSFTLNIQAEGTEDSTKRLVGDIKAFLTEEKEITAYSLNVRGQGIPGQPNSAEQRIRFTLHIKGQGMESALKRLLKMTRFLVLVRKEFRNISMNIKGPGISPSTHSLIQEINVFLKEERGGTEVYPEEEDKNVSFTLNIQAEGTEDSTKRLVGDIKAFLTEEKEITAYSLNVRGQGIPGQPNSAEQRIRFTLHIKGQGMESALKRLLKKTRFLVLGQKEFRNISMNIQGPGISPSTYSLIQEINVFLKEKRGGTEVSPEEEDKNVSFTLNIQAEGTEDSTKRLVGDIKAFLTEEKEITAYSLNVRGQGIPGQPNSAEQRIRFTLHIKGQGMESALKRLLEKIRFLVLAQKELRNISMNIKGPEISPSTYSLIQEINVFLKEERGGTEVSPEEEDKKVSFTLNIQAEGTEVSTKRLVGDIKAFLTEEKEITEYSLNVEGQGIPRQPNSAEQWIPFTLHIKGQGMESALKRLLKMTRFLVLVRKELRNISMNIKGPGISPSTYSLIQEINVFLKEERGGTEVSPEEEDKKVSFTLNIQAEGTEVSTKRLVGDIKAFLTEEKEITAYSLNVRGQGIPGQPNSTEERIRFTLHIKGQGMESALKRLLEKTRFLLLAQKELRNISMNIKGPEISPSTYSLIQEINVFLKEERGGTEVSPEEEDKKVSFTLNIQAEGTEVSTKRLVGDIKAFLTEEKEITEYSLNVEGQGIPRQPNSAEQWIPFTLHIKGQGMESALKRLLEKTRFLLLAQKELRNISMNIKGPEISPSTNSLIQEINVFLKEERGGTEVSPEEEDKKVSFTLNIQAEGTEVSTKRLVGDIKAFLTEEKEITEYSLNVRGQEIPGQPNSAEQRIRFTLHIKGQGMESALKRLLKMTRFLVLVRKEFRNISMNIKGPGISPSTHSLIQEINVFLKEERGGTEVYPEEEDKNVSFTLNIQAEGTEDSTKRLVGDIKAFLTEEKEITAYSLNVRGQGIPGQPNSAEQRIRFTLHIKGQGMESALKRLLEKIRFLVLAQKELRNISMNIKGPEISPSTNSLIQEINVFLKEERGGTEVSPEEEDKEVSFTLKIQAEGTEVSTKRLVGDIKAFLTEEKEIKKYSLNVEGQGIPWQPNSAEQRIRFTLHIKGQGMESALKRLLEKTRFLLLAQKELRNISMNIKGPEISPSTNSLIQEINVFLKEERGGTEVSPEEEDKKVSFTLNIQAEGTEVSTKRLVGDIKAFLTEEKEITAYSLNVRGQDIPGQPNSAEQRIRFTLHIKGQGMESALKRLLEKTRFLVLAQKEFRTISMNIKGPGISPSTYSLIQEINVFLKEERGGTEVSPEEEDKKVSFTLNIQAEGTEVSTKSPKGIAKYFNEHKGPEISPSTNSLIQEINVFLKEERGGTEVSPEEEDKKVSFTLNIQAEGTEVSTKRLVGDIKAFLTEEKEITEYSLNFEGQGIPGQPNSAEQRIRFTLHLKGQGMESALKRLLKMTRFLVLVQKEMRNISMNIKGPGISPSTYSLIQEINVFLKEERGGTEVSPEEEDKNVSFTLNIQAEGTEVSTKRLVGDIKAFLTEEKEITEYSLNEFRNISMNIKGPGISPSTHSLIQEINVFLKEERGGTEVYPEEEDKNVSFTLNIQAEGTEDSTKRLVGDIKAFLTEEKEITAYSLNVRGQGIPGQPNSAEQRIRFTLHIKGQGMESALKRLLKKTKFLVLGQKEFRNISMNIQGPGISPSTYSLIQEINVFLKEKRGGTEVSPEEEDKNVSFTLNIQAEGTEDSTKRLVGDIKAFLTEEKEITAYSLNVRGQGIPGQPNSAEQRIRFTLHIKGQGMESALKRLLEKTRFLLLAQKEFRTISMNIKGPVISPSTNSLIQEINVFLKEERGGTEVSPEEEDKKVSFTLNIQAEGTEVSTKRLVGDIKAFLTEEKEITKYSLNVKGQGIPEQPNSAEQRIRFTLHIKGQGMESALKRLLEKTRFLLLAQKEFRNISMNIKGPEISPSTYSLIQEINVFLKEERGGTEVSPEEEDKKVSFTLNIQAEGTEVSTKRLVGDIKAFLTEEKEITAYSLNVEGQGIPEQPNSAEQRIRFTLHIKGQGMESALKRLLEKTRFLVLAQKELRNISMNVKGPEISPSTNSLIQEINVFLKEERGGTEVSPEEEDKKVSFTLNIQAEGTEVSTKRLVGDIKAFLTEEKEITEYSLNVRGQEIPGQPNSAEQRIRFTLHIKGQGMESALKRLLEKTRFLLLAQKEFRNISMNIKGPGISPSTYSLIQEINVFLKEKRGGTEVSPEEEDKNVSFTLNIQAEGTEVSTKSPKGIRNISMNIKGPGISPSTYSLIQEINVFLKEKRGGTEVSPEEEDKNVSFTLNIQAEGTEDSTKRLVGDIKAFLTEEKEITAYSLNVRGQGIPGQPNSAEQRIRFTLHIKGQGMESALKRLLEKTRFLVLAQKEFRNISMNIKGPGISPSTYSLIQEINVFLKEERGGTEVSPEEEDKKVSFTLNIQAEGTEVSTKRLVGDIKAFLTEEKEITKYSLNVEGQGIPGQPNSAEQRIRFTLHIKGQGMESALKRLLEKTRFLLLAQKELRNISMNIKGPGISPSTNSLIQEINVFLKEERGGTEVSPEEEDKKVSFTLNIQAEGTEVSTKRLVGDIKAFLTEEKEITAYSLNVRGQEIPGQPNSAEQQIRFTLHIKGQGMESALKRLLEKTRFLVLAQKEFRNISMNIKGPGISPSTYSLIQEINVFLKEERGGTEVSPEEEDKKVSFTLNIQAEGTEVSTKRLVGDIKAFLTEEKEITKYSLNVRGQGIPGQPNSAEQRIRFTLHIKGQGMESALKRLLEKTRFLVLAQKEFRNISMNIKGPEISPSTNSLIQEINVFLKEERGGTEVSPEEEDKKVSFTLNIQAEAQKEFRNISMNIKGPGISPSTYSLIQEINVFLKEERGGTEVSPEEEDKKVSFTLNIQAEGTEVSTKRLVGDIKAFLTEEKEITEYSLNEFRNISMNIKGPGISPSTHSLIQEINVFLKEERGGTEVSPEEEDKNVSFTLNIQAEGTEDSTKRLVGDIKAFLTEEKEITAYSLNVRGQGIPGQPNSAEQRIRFTLHIKGQGMESALKRLLEKTRFLVLAQKEFRNISMNIKGPGISPSTYSLIQEINVFLKEKRGGTEVSPEEEDKNVSFTLNIQAEGTEDSTKRLVGDIKAFLTEEKEITAYSLNVRGQGIPGQPNSAEQRIRFTLHIKGQGMESALKRLLEKTRFLLLAQKDFEIYK